MPFDFKKEYKEYYMPPKKPTIVTVPTMNYIAVRGEGDKNAAGGDDGQEITLTMPIKDVIGSGQDILAMGFLADGRGCVMSYEDRNYRFYYVPAEE